MSPHPDQPDVIARAYQLARSGSLQSVEDIRRKLRSEGYDGINAHLAGRLIQRQLRALIAETSQAATPDDAPIPAPVMKLEQS